MVGLNSCHIWQPRANIVLTKHSPKSITIYRHLYTFAPGKRIQDSLGFWITSLGFEIPVTGFYSSSVVLRFWIPIVIGIPDPFEPYSGFQSQDSGSQNQKFTKKSNNLHTRVRRRASQSQGNSCQDCETLLQNGAQTLLISYLDLTLPFGCG